MIRFCEETFDINEICQFRTEIDAYPTLNESNLYYECDLMFFDTVNSIKKYNLVDIYIKFIDIINFFLYSQKKYQNSVYLKLFLLLKAKLIMFTLESVNMFL